MRAAISSAFRTGMGGSHIRPCCNAKLTVWPAATCRRAVAVALSTRKSAGAESSSRSAPPRAAKPSRTGSSTGWISPVFRTWSIGDLDLQLAVGAGEAAQQYPQRPGPQIVAAVVAADHHGVGQHRGAGLRPERGFQGHGPVHVCAADLAVANRPDREVPATRVRDASQHGRRVETGATKPVHRAGPADQRRRAAVRQQGIVADRQAAHRSSPASIDAPTVRRFSRIFAEGGPSRSGQPATAAGGIYANRWSGEANLGGCVCVYRGAIVSGDQRAVLGGPGVAEHVLPAARVRATQLVLPVPLVRAAQRVPCFLSRFSARDHWHREVTDGRCSAVEGSR